MAILERLDEIKSIIVHWSESNLINDELGCDDNCDIEKQVSPSVLNDLVKRTAPTVGSGYDKISLSVVTSNGLQWCTETKFYLHSDTKSLIGLLSNDTTQ